MVPDSEIIDGIAEPPWHETLYDEKLRGRLSIKVPRNEAGESFKKEWAQAHKREVAELELDKANILVYTDGSLSFVRGVRQTGAVVTIRRGKEIAFEKAVALGQHVEVFDAEMEGLAMAAEAVRDIVANAGTEHPIKIIHFFAENTGALQRIHKCTPGKAQACSQRFRSMVFPILRSYRDIEIALAWVPGHFEVPGNEPDKLAKEGSGK
jgi:ribonuclease HI